MVSKVKFGTWQAVWVAMLNISVTFEIFSIILNVFIFEISQKKLLSVQKVHVTNIKVFSLFPAVYLKNFFFLS